MTLTPAAPRPAAAPPPLEAAPLARQGLATALTVLGLVAGLLLSPDVSWAGYLLAYLAGGVPSAVSAARTLWTRRRVDVDLLMVVAALGAASVGQAADGAILLALFSLSNTLQAWAMGRTRAAIRGLHALRPGGATVLRGEAEARVGVNDLRPGDLLLVRPGERFAADAVVELGETAADESALTGEAVPVEKGPGDRVLSGTLNGDGVVRARVTRAAGESTLARLERLVEEARTEKGPTERVAERFEGPYALAVLASIGPVYLLSRYGFGLEPAAAWYRAMTFLVVASPCAVVIGTPAATLSAMAAGARAGVLFKSGAALEALARVRALALDKTGTLTTGRMRLVEVAVLRGDEAGARALAAGLERHSEHPIARAVAAGWEGRPEEVGDVRALRGRGVLGSWNGQRAWIGTRTLAAEQGAVLNPDAEGRLGLFEARGHTTMLLGVGREVRALLAVADTPRPEAAGALERLSALGLRAVMLTGDRAAVAGHVAAQVGVDDVRAELGPEDKLREIAALKASGGVAMVGDGINDAPALAAADVGIAMGGGTDVALESADVALMRGDLWRLAGAVDLARDAVRAIRLNLTLALGVIVIVGTLALAGRVSLPLGVIAHEGGTVLVVLLGLRLLGHPVGHRGARSRT